MDGRGNNFFPLCLKETEKRETKSVFIFDGYFFAAFHGNYFTGYIRFKDAYQGIRFIRSLEALDNEEAYEMTNISFLMGLMKGIPVYD